jgi:hypothetical protein
MAAMITGTALLGTARSATALAGRVLTAGD